MATTESDRRLVQRTLAGERDAFGILVERYGPLVRGLILEKVRRPDEVEDLAQVAFGKAYEQLSTLRNPRQFAVWLRRIAGNQALDWLRAREVTLREQVTAEIVALYDPVRSPGEVVEQNDTFGKLWEAIDHLMPELRQVIVLHYMEGCSQREMARFLGVAPATIHWRLFRARNRLGIELAGVLRETVVPRRDERVHREKIMALLPLAVFFRPQQRVAPMSTWVQWGAPGLAVVAFVGLLAKVTGQGDGTGTDVLHPNTGGGFRVTRAEYPIPPMSVLWEPRKPRRGDRVRVEAAGDGLGAEEEQAFLHFITNPDFPVDTAVPMQRNGEAWEAELVVPDGAEAVFFHVTGKQGPPEGIDAPWGPGRGKLLEQYRWSLLVHDEQGHPVRDAEFMAAEKKLLSGRAFAEVQAHLDRETARYPDNVKAHNERWFHAVREDSTAKGWVREEQRAMMTQYPDNPEVAFAIGRYAGPSLPDTYWELRERFPEYERADELAYMWSRFYGMQKDTTSQITMLEEVIHSHPGSRYVDDAYTDLIDAFAFADPARAIQLADSLIDGDVPGGRTGLASTRAETGEGRAYGVRFELFLQAGDVKGALDLAERLVRSDLDDLSPYQQIGGRLSGRRSLWSPRQVECLNDWSLATRVLEAGLVWADLEPLRSRLVARWASRWPAPVQERTAGERARSLRRAYLKSLGRCYLAQERVREAAVCLQESVELLTEMDPHWGQDEACMLLGEALEGMGDRQGAWEAYERALSFTGEFPPAEEALQRLHAERHGTLEGFPAFLRERRPVAPAFAVTDAQGERVQLSDWAGRPVLLYYRRFFGRPFEGEAVEVLVEWQKRHGEDLVVLYIGSGLIDPERFRALAAEQADGLQVALDDGSVYEEYRPAYGELFLIDRSGRLRWRRNWRGEEQEEILRRIGEVVAEEGEGQRRVAGGLWPTEPSDHPRREQRGRQ